MMFLVRCFFWALPFCYMAFIWYLSSHPSDAVIDTGFSFDGTLKEMLHLIEFAGLYGLWILAFLCLGKLTYSSAKLAACLAILYGFVDEAHQYFVPYRSATIEDLIKDTVGVLVIHFILKKVYFDIPSSRVPTPVHWIVEKLTP